MDFRKLIKFGSNSHVISLPRTWLTKNKLEKGAVIYFHENGNNELILAPVEHQFKQEDKEIVIDANKKELTTLKRELISAYIKGYNVIRMVDSEMKNRAVEIRNELQNLMALEIMEQTQTSISARVFLNTPDVDLAALLRRMDTTIRSMFVDFKESLKDSNDSYSHLSYRDQDINRAYFVILRITNLGMEDSKLASALKLTAKDLFNFWSIAFHLENFGDEIKRIAELKSNTKLNKNTAEAVLRIVSEIETAYNSVMKSYYTNDIESALKYSDTRKKLFERCNEFYVQLNRQPDNLRVLSISERLKNMVELLNKISRRVYD